jgi:eukaryotic-like serine/threonine-protein kinase
MPTGSGARLGPYVLGPALGAGGMGEVYRAHDSRLGRDVAIKLLPPEVADDPERLRRFESEARAAAALNHPNILVVHDVGREHDTSYLVTELLEGRTLRAVIEGGAVPLARALDCAVQIAEGLAAAHARGMVHRDLKPENLFVTTDGRVKILDFGLAKTVTVEAAPASLAHVTAPHVVLGTPGYMAPEQVRGEPVDQRADIFAFGCVLYEMLAGKPPFTAEFAHAVLARHVVDPPPALRGLRDVPSGLDRVILRCLAKTPDRRYASATELQESLAACQAEISARPLALRLTLRRPGVVAAMVAVTVAVVALGAWLWLQQSRARWARTVALPEAVQLIGQGNNYTAFRLLRRAERYLTGDPVLEELLMESTVTVTVSVEPAGAEVSVRDFLDEPHRWEILGRAPLSQVRLPTGVLVWKVSLEDYRTEERLVFTPARTVRFSLHPVSEALPGMVSVPGGPHELFTRSVELADYWIDRHEVTNQQFKAFVDGGGYERPEYWTESFVRNGAVLSWEQARQLLRDRTGRPGPATWELGTYPDGLDDYPVSGVSWYEAAAYCRASGKELPTAFHWYKAADLGTTTQFAALSHFAAAGPAPVGHPLTMGTFGTYDMAGNVKEWTWNEAREARRYVLGGGWNEPSYQFFDPDAQRPLDRQPTYGFRCAKYPVPLSAALLAPIEAPFRDYRAETPVDERVFAVYERLYRFDPTPLAARLESVDHRPEHWRIERVSFAAAYGNERVPAFLFLPENTAPPFQAVVYFPGAAAFLGRPSFDAADVNAAWFLFLVRSGRAVLVPAYKGSYERQIGPVTLPHIWRDVVIHSGKDVQRAVDWLTTRPDIDVDRLAYFGLSMGAAVGPIMTALEPRFKASVLLGGGLYFWRRPPESEAFNFLPRVTVPTLMINGRHDFFFQHETSQVPMFRWLGTPPADKRHAVFDSGHIPSERHEMMKEILEWLDRYLGPVGRRDVSSGTR